MKTLLGGDIPEDALGLLYLCKYEDRKLIPIKAITFSDPMTALDYYANIPNPASQLAKGITRLEFEAQVHQLHQSMKDPKWQEALNEYL